MKILLVCLGNICRSPLAEGILRHKALENELEIEVDSCGTSGYHDGENPDPRSIENAKQNGIDISDLVSRKFKQSDFDHFDIIYTMDSSNYQNIVDLAKTESDKKKVKLILNENFPDKNRNVPDPYFGGDSGFQDVFNLLNEACETIINSKTS